MTDGLHGVSLLFELSFFGARKTEMLEFRPQVANIDTQSAHEKSNTVNFKSIALFPEGMLHPVFRFVDRHIIGVSVPFRCHFQNYSLLRTVLTA